MAEHVVLADVRCPHRFSADVPCTGHPGMVISTLALVEPAPLLAVPQFSEEISRKTPGWEDEQSFKDVAICLQTLISTAFTLRDLRLVAIDALVSEPAHGHVHFATTARNA